MNLKDLHMLGLILPGRYNVVFENRKLQLPPLVKDGVGENLFGRQVQSMVAPGNAVESIEPADEKARFYWKYERESIYKKPSTKKKSAPKKKPSTEREKDSSAEIVLECKPKEDGEDVLECKPKKKRRKRKSKKD